MKRKKTNKIQLPIVRFDKSLEKYSDQVLFKEKVTEAKETLKKVGLPKEKKGSN